MPVAGNDGGAAAPKPKPAPKLKPAQVAKQHRLAALAYALTQLGVVEKTPNWSPRIKLYLNSTGITFPAAWCMAFVHYCYEQTGVALGGGASVGNFLDWARKNNGWVVDRPFKGDLVCYDWNGDGWPDHVGFVDKVLALRWGPGHRFVGFVRTCEGNTSSGEAGSQSDGDGVYVRYRWCSNCRFVRVGNTDA